MNAQPDKLPRVRYRWSPRSFLKQPRNLGRFEEVQWVDKPTDALERDRWLAAQWQHSAAYQVRYSVQFRDKTLEDIARGTRMGKDNFWRLMRGDGVFTLEDLAAFKRLLGVDLVDPKIRKEGPAGTQAEPKPKKKEDEPEVGGPTDG